MATEDDAPVRIGAVACVGAEGPMVAVIFDERTVLMSRQDAERWGKALLREAYKAEGFVLMAAGMELVGLSHKTRDRTLQWAIHHTAGDKQ